MRWVLVPVASSRYQELVDTGQVEIGVSDVEPVERVRIERHSSDMLAESNEERL